MASIKFPTMNQMITIAIAIVIIGFVVKLLPENVRALFRI